MRVCHVHIGYHTRYNNSDSGKVSRSSAFSSLDSTAAKDVAVDTSEMVFLSSEDAAKCCAALGTSDPHGFTEGSLTASTAAPFLWAWLARLGRGYGLPASTIVPPSTSSPLSRVIFTMDSEGVRCRYRTLAIVLGPWSNSDAVTNAAILDLQLTAFWRHLCGDAFRRQSRISDLLRSAVAGIHRRLSTVEISESLSRMSLDRRFPSVRFCTKETYPHTAKDGHVPFVRWHCGSPSWWRCWFPEVTTDSGQALMWALGQQPVSIAVETVQSSFRLCRTGVLTATCGTKLDHGALGRWLRLEIVTDLHFPTFIKILTKGSSEHVARDFRVVRLRVIAMKNLKHLCIKALQDSYPSFLRPRSIEEKN